MEGKAFLVNMFSSREQREEAPSVSSEQPHLVVPLKTMR